MEGPDTFDPSRFSEEVAAEHRKHNFMWIPFGGGAHKCIGMHFARMLFLLTFRELIGKYRIKFAEEGYFAAKLSTFRLPGRWIACRCVWCHAS